MHFLASGSDSTGLCTIFLRIHCIVCAAPRFANALVSLMRSHKGDRSMSVHTSRYVTSRSHAFSIRDIATRAGEGLVHCLQATCSPLQEFLHSQSDCRFLPRDVIPPTLLGASRSSAWFGLTFWLPTAQSKRLGLSRY